jgi:hypothetical protein
MELFGAANRMHYTSRPPGNSGISALGIRTDSVLAVSLTLGQSSYPEMARQLAFFEDLEARLC